MLIIAQLNGQLAALVTFQEEPGLCLTTTLSDTREGHFLHRIGSSHTTQVQVLNLHLSSKSATAERRTPEAHAAPDK
jgi:hypothetical protein